MSAHLFGKRELKRLGSVANDGAGTGYTTFAKSMMAKMGWKEGQGLGKDMQGRSTYVQVKKKEDNAGLGTEKAHQEKVNDQWYFNAFDSALAKMDHGKKQKKKDKRKKREAGDVKAAETGCMYDKMFKATGGARMGMRARAAQNGKLARTEGGGEDAAGGDASANGAPTMTEPSREERRKRKRESKTVRADEGKEPQQAPIQEITPGKRQRKIANTIHSKEGDVDGIVQEAIKNTKLKTRRKDKSGAKKSDRVDEVTRVLDAMGPTTKMEGGRETRETAAGAKGRKKKKKARTEKF